MILWILLKTSGSFSFTQPSFEAVKFPGEFSRCLRQKSFPRAFSAFAPYGTALLSHHIIDGLSTLRSRPTTTSPCIWYEMPMAPISFFLFPSFDTHSLIARVRFFHQTSGSC